MDQASKIERRQGCSGVFVIEDDPGILETVTSALTEEGVQVTFATNGREALELLRVKGNALPCLILLDLMMPVMNGIEFRAEQLRDPALAAIPVVLVTADRKGRLFGEELRVAATLIKPMDLGDLLSVVAGYCGHVSLGPLNRAM